jgi:hypothetical protein
MVEDRAVGTGVAMRTGSFGLASGTLRLYHTVARAWYAAAMDDPRYPIGTFDFKQPATMDRVRAAIDEIAACPPCSATPCVVFDDKELDTPYRDGDGRCVKSSTTSRIAT